MVEDEPQVDLFGVIEPTPRPADKPARAKPAKGKSAKDKAGEGEVPPRTKKARKDRADAPARRGGAKAAAKSAAKPAAKSATVSPAKGKAGRPSAPAGYVANPPHGEKGDFVKVTVTLPPAIYELIAHEATRRKASRERNPQLSAIIREAVVAMLKGRDERAARAVKRKAAKVE